MFDRLRSLILDLSAGALPGRFEVDDHRVAAAALLAYVATVDGQLAEAEKQRVRAVLQAHYGIDEDEARALIREGIARERAAVDLDEFTGMLRRLDAPARRAIVAMMWEVAGADGALHEFEENLITRAAQLLGVAEPGQRG